MSQVSLPQRCNNPEHWGLTVRCPNRNPDSKEDVVCLACEAEGDKETCGSYVFTAIRNEPESLPGGGVRITGNINPQIAKDSHHQITPEEFNTLREISKEEYRLIMNLAKFKARVISLRFILRDILGEE